MQVTTDEATQLAIANFLTAVYSSSRLDEIQKISADKPPALMEDSPQEVEPIESQPRPTGIPEEPSLSTDSTPAKTKPVPTGDLVD